MAKRALPPDIDELSFEQALAELEKIVGELEQGKATLDGAITSYERGALLKQHCEAKLRDAKAKVEKITLSPDGTVGTEPFDVD